MSLYNSRYNVIIYIILVFSFVSGLQAQTSTNPFDIIHTGADDSNIPVADTSTSVVVPQQNLNKFDIISSERRDPDAAISRIDTNTSKSYTKDSIIEASSLSTNPSITTDNPFDISRSKGGSTPNKSGKLGEKTKPLTPTKDIETTNNTINIPSFATKKPVNNKYLLFPLLLCLGTLAFVLHFNSNILKNALNSFTNNNVLMLQQRVENNGFTLQYILLYIVFIVQAGINLSLILQRFSLPFKHISFIAMLLAVLLIYLTRHIFLYIVGREYNLKKESDQYSFTIVTYNILFGIFLIPINLLIIFGPESLANVSLYLSAALFILLLIVRILRSLLASAPLISSNLFQFFMYLCTFEIFPLLILYKVIFP